MAEKTAHEIDLKDSQIEFLAGMVSQYNLPDVSKTIRILIEFAMAEAEARDRIFGEVRCRDC